MSGGGLICKFHHNGSVRSVQIGGVLFAFEQILVRLESSSGTSGGNDSYAKGLRVRFEGRSRCGCGGISSIWIGTEAGQGDDAASTADIDARNRGATRCT